MIGASRTDTTDKLKRLTTSNNSNHILIFVHLRLFRQIFVSWTSSKETFISDEHTRVLVKLRPSLLRVVISTLGPLLLRWLLLLESYIFSWLDFLFLWPLLQEAFKFRLTASMCRLDIIIVIVLTCVLHHFKQVLLMSRLHSINFIPIIQNVSYSD